MGKWIHPIIVLLASISLAPADEVPRQWIDPDTGHRIVRLSQQPGSRTLYFHDNSYTPQGDKLIFNTPDGVAVVDITHLGSDDPKIEIVTQGGGAIMARRTREVYVTRGGRGGGGPVYAVNVDDKTERLVPYAPSTIINCDETFGFIVDRGAIDPTSKTPRPATRPVVPQLQRMFPGKTMDELTEDQRYSVQKEDRLARQAINPPAAAYTFVNLKTGEHTTGGYQYGNLDHQQWSPTDPNVLLYAHEGTWHEVDRTWTIRSDGSDMKLMHKRSMDMEINGHEWWSFDGKMIWYDLQTPRSEDFWIGGVNVETGKETKYHIQRDWWGVHFNSAR